MQTLDNLAMTSGWKINQIKGVKMEGEEGECYLKKKSIQKNQVIIAALAVVIVVAGYVNYKSGAAECR